MKIEVGMLIGPYRLLKECGAGAYGRVFLVENTLTEQHLALKILLSPGTAQQRELRALSRYRALKHPHLLQIYHIDYWEDYLYYTMEAADNLNGDGEDYVPDTLANRLKRSRRLPVETLIKIEQELSAGIHALHAQNSFHRDIKPENILWVNGMAVLGDIGLVAASGEASLIGTPDFMSPAVLNRQRELEPKDDFYALGKVLYCALTGNQAREFSHFPADLNMEKAAPVWKRIMELCAEDSVIAAAAIATPVIPKRKKFWLLLLLPILLAAGAVLAIFQPRPPEDAIPEKKIAEKSVEIELWYDEKEKQQLIAEWDKKYGADGQDNYAELYGAGMAYRNALNRNNSNILDLKRLEECLTEKFSPGIWDNNYWNKELRRLEQTTDNLPIRYFLAEEDVNHARERIVYDDSVVREIEHALEVRHQVLKEYNARDKQMDPKLEIQDDKKLKAQKDEALEKLWRKHEASSPEKNPELQAKIKSRNNVLSEIGTYYDHIQLDYFPLNCNETIASVQRHIKQPSKFPSEDRLLYFYEYISEYLNNRGRFSIEEIYTALKLRDFLVAEYKNTPAPNNSSEKTFAF